VSGEVGGERSEAGETGTSNLRPSTAHLILVGLPGAGKTSLGRRAARELGCPFLDLDEEIERVEGRTVAELFAREGERHFRAREREVTARLRARPPMVVAPGGGWMADPGNPALLRPPSRIIYLRASPTLAVRRMGRGVARRPLLAGPDPVGALTELLARRAPAYETADVIVETDGMTQQQIVRAIRDVAADLWPISP
jgi:shikimate kinase